VSTRGEILLWVVLPYIALAVFVSGNIWRYRTAQYGWSARSTQLLESRWLRWGSYLFHLGALAAIGGHILGVLMPAAWTDAVGIGHDEYHVVALIGGIGAGGACLAGFLILAYRRARFPRVRATTTRMDVAVFAVLAIAIVTGMVPTITGALTDLEYRETVGPWFRGLFLLDPKPELMTDADVLFQIHATAAWMLYLLWPFSRLVHAWSVPIGYFRRSPIQYRSRTGRPAGATATTTRR
jgi:nitrate reductase gamma subunit